MIPPYKKTILNDPESLSQGMKPVSTLLTRDLEGPLETDPMNSSTTRLLPWASIATDPSGMFHTFPVMPRDSASVFVHQRKPTPWTVPLTVMAARTAFSSTFGNPFHKHPGCGGQAH